ncbi:MAG: alpha/beta hydrolase [Flexilinea sp.]
MNRDIRGKLETYAVEALTAGAFIGFFGNVIYDYSINRNRKFFFGPALWKNDSMTRGQFLKTDIAEDALAWAEKTEITELKMKAFDGISLHGYSFLQKKDSNLWLIAIHGYGGMASEMFPIAKEFYEKGYNTLLPECRGSGRSGGESFGMGWLDRNDVLKWTYQIIDKNPDAKIVYYGVSTGAAAVMMAAGEDLPSNVRCVIEDSGYSNLIDLFNHHFQKHSIPWFPMNFAASLVTKIRAGYSFYDASCVNQVAKSKTPILFIHGGKDREIPLEMVYQLYNSTVSVKDILIIPDAAHAYGMYAEPRLYWDKVSGFINRFVEISDGERESRTGIMGQIDKLRGK